MHQATYFMLEHLRVRLNLTEQQVPLALKEYGNTVSSTLPLLMHDLRADGRLRLGTQTILIGFGVGLSWAGCRWTETWQSRNVPAAAAQQFGAEQHPAGNGKVRLDARSDCKHPAVAVKAADGI